MSRSLKFVVIVDILKNKISYSKKELPEDLYELLEELPSPLKDWYHKFYAPTKNPQLRSFDRSDGSRCAIKYNSLNLLDYYCDRRYDWNYAMCCAASQQKFSIVKYCESMGGNDWQEVLISAVSGNCLEIVKYCESKGASNWQLAIDVGLDFGGVKDCDEAIKYCKSKLFKSQTDIVAKIE